MSRRDSLIFAVLFILSAVMAPLAYTAAITYAGGLKLARAWVESRLFGGVAF